MSSTGEKTGGLKLGSLALSVDRLVMPGSSTSNVRTPPLSEAPKDSYAERLAREHGKVLGTPNHEDSELLKQFIEPPSISVLKLDAAQILEIKRSQKQQWEAGSLNKKPTIEVPAADPKAEPVDLPFPKEIRTVKTIIPPLPDEPKKEIAKEQELVPILPTKKVAPRAQPFSEESYVRVKVITQNIDLNIGHVGTTESESITWMQRDAIKQYLTIQDIERHRAAMKGAVYRTFQHDA